MTHDHTGADAEGSEARAPSQPEHPSQAEGADPEHPATHPDPPQQGHPSQAEGEDDGRST
ncbi:hypothetical protein [Pseudactinotalea terrae]|uniref:hypothetical protein n=1 Tax=Pseudactinotalea terrae TaxID=1743262 RepID=UPI0012E2643E|nr:hypothetical protein [Pseudactinotalea terrae]